MVIVAVFITSDDPDQTMPETCENCGCPLKDWTATHCSEECLLSSIQYSKTLQEHSEFDKIISIMRRDNRFDRKLLDELK